jgi:Flp pilus assembly pilin Flp
MVYGWMGRAHAALLRDERGQGTVEYVGLILLIAGVIGAVVAWGGGGTFKGDGIGKAITDKLKTTIETLGGGGGGK